MKSSGLNPHHCVKFIPDRFRMDDVIHNNPILDDLIHNILILHVCMNLRLSLLLHTTYDDDVCNAFFPAEFAVISNIF